MLRAALASLLFLASLAGQTKPLPPPGIPLPPADRAALEAGLRDLRAAIDRLTNNPLLPDVLIFHEAVRYALQYNEFFKPAEIATAQDLLQLGAGARRRNWREGTIAVDHRHRPRGPRLRLEDRQERAALRPGGAGLLLADRAAPLAARRLVPRPRRDAERGQLPDGPAAARRRIHAARHHRAAPLRPLLQRQSLRRRGRSLRSAGRT